ncbi:MAG TPA: hypothetical protein PKE04_00110 [Clostridia bacterium]|nr:hypothetical protein [Clostridia bacterium]
MVDEIRWAARVPRDKIKRLYMSDANGRLDEELLQDVGYAFLARAESVIATNRIHANNIVACPSCGEDVLRYDDAYTCICGWTIAAKNLHLTYKGKQLIGPSIVGFAEKFIADWNGALGDPRKQMLAIDYLIHRFHWEMTEIPTRPVAVNYIEGNIEEIKRLILELAGDLDGEQKANMDSWLKNRAKSDTYWGNKRKKCCGV